MYERDVLAYKLYRTLDEKVSKLRSWLSINMEITLKSLITVQPLITTYRQPEKKNEYQTLVLNYRPFGNVLAVSSSGVARACALAHIIFTAVSKRDALS